MISIENMNAIAMIIKKNVFCDLTEIIDRSIEVDQHP